jgi:hypothetical protein
MRVLAEPINTMQIWYMPVYTPTKQEQEDTRLYARNARIAMCKALGVPSTEHRCVCGCVCVCVCALFVYF